MKKLGRKIKAVVFRHFDVLFLFFLMIALGHFATIQLATMDIFERKIQPLEDFQRDAPRRIMDEVEAVEEEVVAMNAEQQFAAGIRADGTEIEPPYTAFTVRIKGFKGQPTDRVTLRDTGDFHGAFRLEFEPDQFTITSGDAKLAKLQAKYGETIMGLTDENIQKLIERIRDPLTERLKSELA